MTTIYNQKVFLMETRLRQLAQLNQWGMKMNASNFQEILNEMKTILIHCKMNLYDQGNFTFVPYKTPVYLFERETTEEIVDQMIYIFFQEILYEFESILPSLYDAESLALLKRTIMDPEKKIYLSGYQRYLYLTVSKDHFEEWDQKRKQYFIPIMKTVFLKKEEYTTSVECGICLEDHGRNETRVCNCSHEFGQMCFQNWMDICKKNSRDITCPNCREQVTETTRFQQKGRPSKVA